MTLAEWHVVIDAFIAANTGTEQAPTEEEFLQVLSEEMAAGRA